MHFYNLVTDFKTQVYKAVRRIPKGETKTYKEIAVAAGKPRAWRVIGNILNKNFNPKIPCHRIIRSDGKMGSYNRGGSKRKKTFLQQEKAI
ncbi:MAG: 6-O-methylguanine DNA methyltransferase [Candidatus Nealsonbacteria bacterium CG_4_9_14_0_8_um_filter_35_12]|uniref:6-O-methylguanine DNA methyltransferase n=1 Tax=Candidatus Nealsonbacteria bacterium CG_4_9_14_0_8_um_filter_35_12 TaxID=1974692 RepID=A0A2M8DMM6_9BACT|nr:MAG: 6-O-methylguanine DNA methyltransferase [Candidatus Nealsonbacteria bacterium CG_4_9_14_0_8_um_filter_35_12]